MRTGYALCAAIAVAALAWGCSDDGGDGDDDDGGQQTLEPGREVMGCFDCAETEYCIVLDPEGTENYRCAEADCGMDCTCIVDDGKKRHDECANYSCQEGAGILYCSG